MNSAEVCFDCGVRQCLRIARLCGREEVLPALRKMLEELRRDLDFRAPPSTLTSKLLVATMEFLGEPDPFRDVRAEQNRMGARFAEGFQEVVTRSAVPLSAALLLAAAGNVIDVGPGQRFELQEILGRCRFARDDRARLFQALSQARRLVYILDNAGEVWFDRLVLEHLPPLEVTVVARSHPILNDVTVAEAEALGLGRFGRLLGTGSRYLGVDLNTVSDEFREAYYRADVVIAKGHANFESLVDDGRDGFYILTAKCELVAARLGVGVGDSVCLYSPGRS